MPPEGLMGLQVQELVAEEQHLMLEQSGVDLLILPVAQPAEIDPPDLGPDERGDGIHLDRLIAHGFLRSLPRDTLLDTLKLAPARQ